MGRSERYARAPINILTVGEDSMDYRMYSDVPLPDSARFFWAWLDHVATTVRFGPRRFLHHLKTGRRLQGSTWDNMRPHVAWHALKGDLERLEKRYGTRLFDEVVRHYRDNPHCRNRRNAARPELLEDVKRTLRKCGVDPESFFYEEAEKKPNLRVVR